MTDRARVFIKFTLATVLLWAALIYGLHAAFAQVITSISSSTITSGGTFQIVFPGRCAPGVSDPVGCPSTPLAPRNGCTIVNNGTHSMFVWPNPQPGATDAKATLIPANGGVFNCQIVTTKILQDPIYIDGTTADAFYAGLQ